jgi:hypothetical protein
MWAIPGELLTTTQLQEDVTYNKAWGVPFGWQGIQLYYGDLLLVVASWQEWVDVFSPTTGEIHEKRKSPALLLHLRRNKILSFEDIEDVGWLWRPDAQIDELVKEIKRFATS